MSHRYSAVSAIMPASEPSVGMLADAIASETRLVEDLTAIMRRQRRAVAEDDMQGVEDSVFATHRVLATLQEARIRRRTINRMFGEREDISVSAMEDVLGSRMTPAIRLLRDVLQGAAKTLSEEVSLNRDILRGALAGSDSYVRTLVGASTSTYGNRDAGLQSSSGRVLLNLTG